MIIKDTKNVKLLTWNFTYVLIPALGSQTKQASCLQFTSFHPLIAEH